jgi:hypothetical protein
MLAMLLCRDLEPVYIIDALFFDQGVKGAQRHLSAVPRNRLPMRIYPAVANQEYLAFASIERTL